MRVGLKQKFTDAGKLVDESKHFYATLLDYTVEDTGLEILSDEDWYKFTKNMGLDEDSQGVYLPRNQTAVVKEDSVLNLFHEYFGHGLYCEKTKKGQELVGLEKKLLEEEEREFNDEEFTLEELQEFREGSETYQRLQEFNRENLFEYELFSVWSEYFLSKKHDLLNDFEEKYEPSKNENVHNLIGLNKNIGDLGTFYEFNLPRRTNTERARILLQDILGEKLDSVELGVLFGSRKEFSDVDIYLISDEITPFHNDWIDVRVHNTERFREGLEFFDVRVTEPLFAGEFILGDRALFQRSKELLQNKRITEDAIQENYNRARMYADYENSDLMLCDKVGSPETYVESYLINAHALEEGRKLFTYKNILSFSQEKKTKGGEN